MLYRMELQEEPFQRVRDGQKTLELRIYDEKRKKIALGDEIEFVKSVDPQDRVRVEVTGLLLYRNFSDLINDIPAALLGYEESEKGYLKTSMYEMYTKEEEEKCAVVGIRIRLIQKE